MSSSSSQEGSRSSQSSSFRRSSSPSSSRRSRSSGRCSHTAVALHFTPPTPYAVLTLLCGPPGTRLLQDHPPRHLRRLLLCSSHRWLHCLLRAYPTLALPTCSSPPAAPALPIDDASSLRVAVPCALCHGSSTRSSFLIAVDSTVTCSHHR